MILFQSVISSARAVLATPPARTIETSNTLMIFFITAPFHYTHVATGTTTDELQRDASPRTCRLFRICRARKGSGSSKTLQATHPNVLNPLTVCADSQSDRKQTNRIHAMFN